MVPRLRSFGRDEVDLSIDFGTHNRAVLVTRLLAQCSIDATADTLDLYRRLSAGKRLQCLLQLAMTDPSRPLSIPCRCLACHQELELELTLHELSDVQQAADAIATITVGSGPQRLALRKPTGHDMEAWGEMAFADEGAALGTMIAGLLIDPPSAPIAPASIAAIEEALEAADPLIDFRCTAACGECGEANECQIDLMEIALHLLRRSQHELVASLHRLATHYHWTEQEIFAVPAWRRQRYLQLIGATGK